ncbi:MAG: TatD family hydrolase [Solirubrobacteraceae bacterium]|nr:TatD family hydrolase [Solirubrobacteraceae bacterium]
MIDSHTHLSSCAPPDEELVAAARDAGVRRILTVGMDEETWPQAIASAEAFEEVYCALGRHPNMAEDFDDTALERLRTLAEHPKCRAIGETGLDYFRDTTSPEAQAHAFHAHIELARDTGKPLIIHTRAADDDTIATLRERADGVTVIMHCFSMPDRLDECLEQGWWISFAGNVTYKANAELADAAARVPADRILVETDAPYLTAQAVRKERNQPAFVTHTAQFLCERRDETYAELEAAVERNAATLFGW